VIRLNALTGREQRRFMAEWRTPEQKNAGTPRIPDMWDAKLSGDGLTLVTSHREWVYVWNIESGALRRKIRHSHPRGWRLALAPDGRTLASSAIRLGDQHREGRGDDTIRLYDIETGEQILPLESGDGRASVMEFSPDGLRLFTGFGRGSGIVWDVRREQEAPGNKRIP
jgi:WD40 repeat protein